MRAMLCAALFAVGFSENSVAQTDTDDADVRINPQVDSTTVYDAGTTVAIPSFVNTRANVIKLNGADWTELKRCISNVKNRRVNVVHIGDSHLQADVATAVVRKHLQADYGDAGRGLVTPLKMAGTNEPRDYSLRATEGEWSASKLMKRPWATAMGFTGTSAAPMSGVGAITVATLSRTGTPQMFDCVRIFHSGRPTLSTAFPNVAQSISADTLVSEITLYKPISSLEVNISLPSGEALYGVSLERTRPGGLLYHVIGNNGATYLSYNAIADFSAGVSLLKPHLIILSLGANEAFGSISSDDMYNSIDVMVSALQRQCPDAQILLTTPMECQRSTTVKRRVKGRGRRHRTVTTRAYTVNTRVATMRDAILRYGREHNIPTYDFYEIAGGAGASSKWAAAGMMSPDRIHNSVKGYNVQGELLYDALKSAFSKPNISISTIKR